MALLDFDSLCRRPLGSADYLAIAAKFPTVLIDHVPVMSRDDYDAARRFMTLIDALYEHRVHVIVAARNSGPAFFSWLRRGRFPPRTPRA